MQTTLLSVTAVCLVILTLYLSIILIYFMRFLKVAEKAIVKIEHSVDKIDYVINDAGEVVRNIKDVTSAASTLITSPIAGILKFAGNIIGKFMTKKSNEDINVI